MIVNLIGENLSILIGEIELQSGAGALFLSDILGFHESIANAKEYIEANECGLACEIIVSLLESFSL